MNVGGPAWQVATLSRKLDPSLIEQRLLVGFVGPDEEDFLDLRARDVTARQVDGLGRSIRPWSDLRALITLVREIRRFRPDIVHTHTAKAGVLGRLAALSCRVPIIVHSFHGHVLHGYFTPRVTAVVRVVERTLARHTTRIVAVGEKVRDDLVEAGIGRLEQYVVIPPGVELARTPTRAAARLELGIEESAFVVAFVARLTQIKRPDRVLEVARRMSNRAEVAFLVAGGGELLASMRREASNLPNVTFLGWRSDVETVYAASDLVLLTSDNEGMPVSLLEAAYAGRPSVTTAVGSAGEVVVDGVTGFVTGTDVDELAAAVLRLLDDEALRGRMGTAAARRAVEQFHADRLVERTAALYAGLVEQRKCQ